MMKNSLSVYTLNALSTGGSGYGIYTFLTEQEMLQGTSVYALIAISCAGTGLIQGIINKNWRDFFVKKGGAGAAAMGTIASAASLVTACAGYLTLWDSSGLQSDMQIDAVQGHQTELQVHEIKYLEMATAFGTLSSEMTQNAIRESTTGPVCANDNAAAWRDSCGPRCRFMDRSASSTADMSATAGMVSSIMAQVAVDLAEGDQARMDRAYTQAQQLPRSAEVQNLRAQLAGLKRDLTAPITDPLNGTVFSCEIPSALALVIDAENKLNDIMTLPARPVRPEIALEDTLTASAQGAIAILMGRSDEMRSAQKVSFWIAAVTEIFLWLALRASAHKALRTGSEQQEAEEIDATSPDTRPKNPDKLRSLVELTDRFVLNGGRFGRFFAIPTNDHSGVTRNKCMELVDYHSLAPSAVASGVINLADVQPEWVRARSGETGGATHFELYEWTREHEKWRRFARRDMCLTSAPMGLNRANC
jgi:hypothetical protein